ncbi:MAG: MaoC family dehydratase N-terminal domain-containing protein [Bdellovibrionales bacterium]|nr:MaoC family dehydratase N-terminal domain-containing protein [Bdellovibrionales bacterium]
MTEISSANLIPFKVAGTVTLEWLKEFARVSGDYNPIHQDEAVAKSMGLPGVIAHGMLTASLLHSRALEAIADYRNLRGFSIGGSQTRFRAMTFLGDEISIGGQWQVMGANELKLDLQARKQSGETTVTASFRLVRPAAV